MKRCAACQVEKAKSEFGKNRSRKDGLNHTCRDCIAEKRLANPEHFGRMSKESYERTKDKVAASRKKYYEANKDKARCQSYRTNYGITLEDFQKMELDQMGACAICEEFPKTRLNVDHNHKTLQVRGLLCTRCNNGLAFVEDADYLARARRYLAEHEGAKA